MEKYRIAFTVQDYYDYIGTNTYRSIKERMLESIPEQFKKNGYNIKFKVIKHRMYPWHRYYRVHLSLITNEEKIQKVINRYKTASFNCGEITYKEIKKIWN